MSLAGVAVAVAYTSAALWALVVNGPLLLVGLDESLQREHSILRNFPIIGHARYLLEMLRPEIQVLHRVEHRRVPDCAGVP